MAQKQKEEALEVEGVVTQALATHPDLQARVMDTISSNTSLAGPMIDKLIGSDSTRSLLLDKLMSNGDATQALMAKMAKNNVAKVATNKPPMTARPSGAFCSPPSPSPSAMGNMPMIIASAVIMTGRRRV